MTVTSDFEAVGPSAYADTGKVPSTYADTGKVLSAYADTGKVLSAYADTGKVLSAYADTGKVLSAYADTGKVLSAYADTGINPSACAEKRRRLSGSDGTTKGASAFADQSSSSPSSSGSRDAERDHFVIDETYWGYIVRSTEAVPFSLWMMQFLSWGMGLGFCVVTLGLWVMPQAMFDGSVLGMKIGASVVTIALAAFCLWFASRGLDSEIQIDTKLGEIREVVRNRAGRPTLIGRYGFDAIGSVRIDVGAERQGIFQTPGQLVLYYRNAEAQLPVARGAVSKLGILRDRIGRDLMLSPKAEGGRGLTWN